MDDNKIQAALELMMSAEINIGNFSRLGFAVIPLVQDQIREAIKLLEGEARVIAGAPELLEALKGVLRIAKAASIGVTGNAPRLARAEAAIAKATTAPAFADDLRFGEG